MNHLSNQIASLTPEQLQLLQVRLKEKGIDSLRMPIPRLRNLNQAKLSFAQERLWFLGELQPNSSSYNTPFGLELSGELNVQVLERAFNEILRRHQALRTTISMLDNSPLQVIAPFKPTALQMIDLSDGELENREQLVVDLSVQEARRPFDLARGPLLRHSLLRLSRTFHVLLVTVHHIAFDGWSMGILVDEMVSLYGAYVGGDPSPLREPVIQYADYAEWERQWLGSERLARQLDFWREGLQGAPRLLKLPTDRPGRPSQTANGAHQVLVLAAPLSRAIRQLSLDMGATVFMTLLAAFYVMLHRYSGQDDICVGTPVANRNRRELEGLIGFFSNTLVMRCDLSGDPSFRELLKRLREFVLGAYANQELPFEQLVEALQPVRGPNYTPLFQMVFALQNAPIGELKLPGVKVVPLMVENHTAKFDLALNVTDSAAEFVGVIEYKTNLFDGTTVRRMFHHYQIILEAVTANPDIHLIDIELEDTESSNDILPRPALQDTFKLDEFSL